MNIHRTSLVFAAFLAPGIIASPLSAEDTLDWKGQLARDLVEIKGERMVIEGYDLCKIGSANIQLRTYSEAPHDGSISRDNFVAITSASIFAYQMALGDAECKDIKAPIGDVDIEQSIYMTSEGIKQKFRDHRTNTENSTTELWSELLAD
ncbi:MAG: hypothetical protein WBO37_11645 [Gammaproteobacteria bacterium]